MHNCLAIKQKSKEPLDNSRSYEKAGRYLRYLGGIVGLAAAIVKLMYKHLTPQNIVKRLWDWLTSDN